MRYRDLGNTGIKVSVVGLGTWAIGGGSWWGPTDDNESIRTIQAGIDVGVNLIDTAPGYGWGRSEEVVGRAIQGRRDGLVLATKCGLWWDDDRGAFFFELDGRKVNRCLRPETIQIELEASLSRLRVDTIDLYQTHWQAADPDPTPIADTMACLLNMKQQGKIRAIGVCNSGPAHLDQYRAVGELASCQSRYSMLDRSIESDVVPYCTQNSLAILAYSPLEQGLLTGRIGVDRQFIASSFRHMNPWFTPANRQRVITLVSGWRDLTRYYSCTIPQLVVAWTIQQPGITSALCGGRQAEQIQENAKASMVVLKPQDDARIRHDLVALGEP